MKDKITPGYYAVIPADVRYNKKLSSGSKLLYGEITALCNKEGYCWASNSYFSELYGCVPQTISNWIQELISENFIRTENFPDRGNLRHIYLNLTRNQESFDFEQKTTIQNNYIVSKENGELSKNFIDLSKKNIELSKNFISMNNTINTTSNITSSSRTAATPKILEGDELEEWIKLRYRHWFTKVDPHFHADIVAVQKEIIKTSTQDIRQEDVLKIVDRAFERVVQEKTKKDWVTREVIVRIGWGLQDYFKAKEKEAAKAKKEAIESLKPGDAGLWNPSDDDVFKKLLNKKMFDDKPKAESTIDKNSLDYKRRQSLFNQAVDEGK